MITAETIGGGQVLAEVPGILLPMGGVTMVQQVSTLKAIFSARACCSAMSSEVEILLDSWLYSMAFAMKSKVRASMLSSAALV